MHPTELLHKQLSLSCPNIHKSRLNALFISVNNLLHGGKLTLTALGRSSNTSSQVKNKIKQMDRLLGNTALHLEIDSIYNVLTSQLIGNKKHPIILVDWSNVDIRGKFQVLKATLAFQGRGITILDHIEFSKRPKQKHNNSLDQFLDRLSKIIPNNCKPIIVTDAGFSAKWFKRIEAKGWYWIGRLRGMIKMRKNTEDEWLNCKKIYPRSSAKPKILGEYTLSKKSPISCSVHIYKKPKVGRIRTNRDGSKKKRSLKNDYEKSAYEPWLLACNLPKSHSLSKKVVKAYTLRMQIEETFRDIKNQRYGFGLETTLSNSKPRIAVLMLIAAITHFILGILGKAICNLGLHRKYQANTIKNRAVLSLWYLGKQVFYHSTEKIPKQLIESAILDIKAGIPSYEL